MLSLKNWQENRADFEEKDVQLPLYNVKSAKNAGARHPAWIHVGAGNLYRTFHAAVSDDLLNQGKMSAGVVVADMRSPFAVDRVYRPFDNDFLMVTMLPDGTLHKRILASTAKALFASPERSGDWNRIVSYFKDSSLQLVTYTITEKGYRLTDSAGGLTTAARNDIAGGPTMPTTAMGRTCALLLARFNADAQPIAMVSTDNFSQNGMHFRESVLRIAEGWLEGGLVPRGFVDYISDERCVSFPWSMIDRITPNPSQEVLKHLTAEGFSDIEIVHTPGGTGMAPFANTEASHYLVLEDSFPNGRPSLEDGGIILCDRETAEKADTMKVTACLNPLHTCLAIFGCLLGYTRIWQEMEDGDLVSLIKHIGYDEDLPVVENPKVIDPHAFLEELLTKRLPNKSLPDTPQRIASDTSEKIPIRYGHTLNAYANDSTKDPSKLTYIPLTIAGWLRYLLALDDESKSFTPSADPLLSELQSHLAGIGLGTSDADRVHEAVAPILSNKEVFACDLYRLGLGEKIESMLLEMLAGPGAVRLTIERYI